MMYFEFEILKKLTNETYFFPQEGAFATFNYTVHLKRLSNAEIWLKFLKKKMYEVNLQ